MDIKFLKGVFHFGYAYRAGDTTGSLPDKVAKEFIATGYAVPAGLKKRPEKPPEAKVQTTVVRKKK